MKDPRATQAYSVRRHLDQFGYITDADALAMRIGNLNEVVRRLRNGDYPMTIETQVVTDGTGRKFKRYARRAA